MLLNQKKISLINKNENDNKNKNKIENNFFETTILKNFNKDIMFYALEFSAAAYCSTDMVEHWNCSECIYKHIKILKLIKNEKTNTFGYIGLDNEKKKKL